MAKKGEECAAAPVVETTRVDSYHYKHEQIRKVLCEGLGYKWSNDYQMYLYRDGYLPPISEQDAYQLVCKINEYVNMKLD